MGWQISEANIVWLLPLFIKYHFINAHFKFLNEILINFSNFNTKSFHLFLHTFTFLTILNEKILRNLKVSKSLDTLLKWNFTNVFTIVSCVSFVRKVKELWTRKQRYIFHRTTEIPLHLRLGLNCENIKERKRMIDSKLLKNSQFKIFGNIWRKENSMRAVLLSSIATFRTENINNEFMLKIIEWKLMLKKLFVYCAEICEWNWF